MLDPWRTLGLVQGASEAEIKRAYRRLAKEHHPDAGGPSELPRFLAIQAAYEMLSGSRAPAVAGRGGDGGAGRAGAPPWQADPARARATREAWRRTGRRGSGAGGNDEAEAEGGTRPRGGPAAGGAPNTRRSGSANSAGGATGGTEPGRGPTGASANGAGRSGGGERARDGARHRHRRKATPGSTTYDDAVHDVAERGWTGSAWYGQTSGTYWTINPREYADPRKHGPEYQARARRAAQGTGAAPDSGGLDPAWPDRVAPAPASTDPAAPAPRAAPGAAVPEQDQAARQQSAGRQDRRARPGRATPSGPGRGPDAAGRSVREVADGQRRPPVGGSTPMGSSTPGDRRPGPAGQPVSSEGRRAATSAWPGRRPASEAADDPPSMGQTASQFPGGTESSADPSAGDPASAFSFASPASGTSPASGATASRTPSRTTTPAIRAPSSLGDVVAGIVTAPARPPVRFLLALAGWPPIGIGTALVLGQLTGCGRYAASCSSVTSFSAWMLLAQLLVVGLLLAAPPVARLASVGSLAVLLAALPVVALLTAAGATYSQAGPESLLVLLAVAWAAGIVLGWRVLLRARGSGGSGRPAR